MKQRNVLLEAALDYINRGIVVFPVKAGDKVPLTRNGFKAATVDDRTVCEWWKKWPDANIGIPTGRLSAFFVLDIDADKGGFDSLKVLEARYGEGDQYCAVAHGLAPAGITRKNPWAFFIYILPLLFQQIERLPG